MRNLNLEEMEQAIKDMQAYQLAQMSLVDFKWLLETSGKTVEDIKGTEHEKKYLEILRKLSKLEIIMSKYFIKG